MGSIHALQEACPGRDPTLGKCYLAHGLVEDVPKIKVVELTCLRKTIKTMAMAKICGYYYI